jgi:hypothetical protein
MVSPLVKYEIAKHKCKNAFDLTLLINEDILVGFTLYFVRVCE